MDIEPLIINFVEEVSDETRKAMKMWQDFATADKPPLSSSSPFTFENFDSVEVVHMDGTTEPLGEHIKGKLAEKGVDPDTVSLGWPTLLLDTASEDVAATLSITYDFPDPEFKENDK